MVSVVNMCSISGKFLPSDMMEHYLVNKSQYVGRVKHFKKII